MDNTVRYCYLHDNQKKRHIAIARKFDKKNSLVTFAFSLSHPDDTFKKKLGRTIAQGRLDAGKSFTVHVPVGMTPMQCVIGFFAWSNDERLPMAVQKMGAKWFEEDLKRAMSAPAAEQYKDYLNRNDFFETKGQKTLNFNRVADDDLAV